MNPLDALLRDELNRLLDRIAASTRAGVAKVSARQLPDLRARLDEAEERLAAKREALDCETSFEGPSQVREQVLGHGLELLAVGATVGLRRWATVALAELDEQVECSHLHGLFDALRQLRVDALDQATRIVGAVAKPGGLERIVHHGLWSMRLSP